MKAIVLTKYGSPDEFRLKEVRKPVPMDNEILIRIYETTVSPADCAFRQADPFITRFFTGIFKPRVILGAVLSGEVEAIGKDVKQYKEGDQVFASCSTSFGAYAEYKCLSETDVVAIKPSNMSYGEAAAVCDGALTALIFLNEKANICSGQKIFIIGASGSIGTAAVQIAKYFGLEVTSVCSTDNTLLVKSLGADKVVDYTKEDYSKSEQTYDIIFDTVGKGSFNSCKSLLKQKGIYLTTVPSLTIMLQMFWTSKFGNKKAVFATTGLLQDKAYLDFLRELIEAGKLISVIDKKYPIEQIAEAHRYVEKGHKKGNVVLTISSS